MKICYACSPEGTPKDESEFWVCKSRPDGRQTRCIVCAKRLHRERYQDGRVDRKVLRKRNRGHVKDLKQMVREYLESNPCVDCGEADPVVLDFDHVRGKKRENVSRMVTAGLGEGTVQKEMEKCEIRCANCHRRVTARRRGSKG